MKTEVKEISPTRKELHIEVEADAIRKVYDKVSRKYSQFANVPGFRKGFAPIDVVRMRYKDDIKNDVLRELLPDRVTKAIEESNLEPISEPELHLDDAENVKVNGSQNINLHVHVEVMPEIPTPEYVGIEAVRRIRPVNDEDLEKIIEERRNISAALVPVEGRKSQVGDTLIVDLEGKFLDLPNEESIVANDMEIKIGDDNIEKAFTENLVGLEQDETKNFSVVYPEDFPSPHFANKTVDYKAFVKSVGVLEVPEADDEWAASLEEGFESMKDLRKKLREDLGLMAKAESDNKVRDEVINKLIEKHKELEVPPSFVRRQAEMLLNNFAQDISQRGMDLNKLGEDFVKMAYQNMLPQAENDVRGALLLEKVAEIENIEVSQEEINEEIEKMATYYRITAEEIRTALQNQGGEQGIADRLRSRKSVEAVYSKAKITDGEWIDESQIATDEPEPVKEEKPKKTKAKAVKEEKPKAKKAKE
ncbi:MAG: trigger factor [Pyrinomonadaceae bacterium]|jgi:trigger factor|nr:trigger factor [Pyrinomonadaceae bacterium]